ncbi:MAG: SUMF1/EgtB/PvdO family nonheme iron enzyme [Candidatus Aminicenantes bacterium]|nr:SUMF1/EgtB/PvdO family nonheme iron enzyme [Candidatus Aminicenantes bacterium]NIM80130.1 SUMF1/EgtB/PvdO family nonheme iron enzyme [Candidatus Aminicenantes bacterium]NIN19468.1 SUMF1/EgtB/PvdO family nonheme iron enzyme [Candidatus Aminicenantes bacterium]NIN43367.1 SUMF1/EgtB/PvdO family nonheme iron enzyme [Candidatus Aminicenantes bacterium]NIN86112.1 SUMF1/EgtB/PvdO family nonheme iron enzyme [Candidatus Aminicenantes bacterium]
MIKKGMVLLVIFVMVVLSFAQEGTKRVRIKETKGNDGKRWAICIGINDYENKSIVDLKKARNDAKELGKVLEECGQFDHVYVMTDDSDPRGENYPKLMSIRSKLDYLKGFIDPEDLVVFSFSGHGIANSEGKGFLVMADSYVGDLFGSSLKVEEIVDWLKEMNVKKSLLLLDACREKIQKGKNIQLNGLKAERFRQAEVAAAFFSTKSGWFSYEEEKEGTFGIFTKYVIEGLKGHADSSGAEGDGDGIVTFSELGAYVEEAVSKWALREGRRQRPYTKIYGEKFGDLALSVYEDKPADVIAVESKAGRKAYKNNKDYWEIDHGDGIIMVYIPAGEFIMGSNDGQDDEKPAHNVYLDGYWMGKYEVTFDQYDKYCKENNQNRPADKEWGRGKRPVIHVSWDDANAYCDWLFKKTGLKFKLPTEAQWEKAARGTDGREYPWGNSPPSGDKFNFADKNLWEKEKWSWADKNIDDGYAYAAPVGSYPQGASPYGLLDMAGNVWECCSDWYDYGYYKNAPKNNPTGPEGGTNRVIRGGSWSSVAADFRCADRYNFDPSERNSNLGFRLCQDNN